MLHWFIPQVLEKRNSKFNGQIEVVKFQGKVSVRAGGFQQSGPLLEKVWQEGLKRGLTLQQKEGIENVLVLGLGAGTVVPVLDKVLPKIKTIMGVEIDPVMIELGKKYFELDDFPKLTVTLGNAFVLMNRFIKNREKFDLVLVDIYKGSNPQVVYNNFSIISTCRKLLRPRGQIVLDYLEPKLGNSKIDLPFPAKIVTVDFNKLAFTERK